MQPPIHDPVSATPAESSASSPRRQRDGGYLLLAILFMMAVMVITATIEAPRLVQQIKRDREEEMIHRGTEYARAVKKFYKKFGAYPANLEQLDNTNQIRFLRKRYKDPLTKDGKWKQLSYTDVQAILLNGQAGPGVPAAALGTQGAQNPGTSASALANTLNSGDTSSPNQAVNPNGVFAQGGAVSLQQSGALNSGSPAGNAIGGQDNTSHSTPSQGNSPFANTFSLNSNPAAGNPGSANPGAGNNPNQPNSPLSQNSAAGQAFGGAAIVGVASVNKDPTIRIYNKKKTYNEWMFIYDPTQDRTNTLLRGPWQPVTLGGAQGQGIPGSTPVNQMGGQQSPFGQQNPGGFGQQPSTFGQQPNSSGQQGGYNQPQQPQQPQ